MHTMSHSWLVLSTFAPLHVPVTPPGATAADPAKQDEMGKAPGVLQSDGRAVITGAKRRCKGKKEADEWKKAGLGAGLACGDPMPDGTMLVCIDSDVKHRALAAALEAGLRHEIPGMNWRGVDHPDHVKWASLVRVKTGTPMPASLRFMAKDGTGAPEVVELIATKHVVVHGIHAGRGAAYIWRNPPLSYGDLPDVTDQLAAIMATLAGQAATVGFELVEDHRLSAMASAARDRIEGDEPFVRWLMGHLSNDPAYWSARNRPDPFAMEPEWWQVCALLCVTSGGAPWGHALWLAFCAERGTEKDAEAKWNWCLDNAQNTGLPALMQLAAEAHGPAAFAGVCFGERGPKDTRENAAQDAERAVRRLFSGWSAVARRYARRAGMFLDREKIGEEPLSRSLMNDFMSGEMPALRRELHAAGADKGWSEAASFTGAWGWLERHVPGLGLYKVAGVMFWPGKPPIYEHAGQRYLNPWEPVPASGATVTAAEIKPFLDVLDYMFGPMAPLALRYYAFMLQFPGQKPGFTFVIQSRPGLGKSMFGDTLRALFGLANTLTIPFRKFQEKFQEYVAHWHVIVEEVENPHNPAQFLAQNKSFMGNLPAMLDPRTMGHASGSEAPNTVGFTMFSNARVPFLITEKDERRACLIDLFKIAHRTPAEHAAFCAWRDQHVQAIRDYLHALPLSAAEIAEVQGDAPMTDAKQRLISDDAGDPLTAHLLDLQQAAMDGTSPNPDVRMIMTGDQIKAWLARPDVGIRLAKNDGRFKHAMAAIGAKPVREQGTTGTPGAVNVPGEKTSRRLWRLADKDSAGNDYSALSESDQARAHMTGKWPAPKAGDNVTALPVKTKKKLDAPEDGSPDAVELV